MEERGEEIEPNSQRAVCKQQLHKHSNKMTHKISVRNYVLFKSWFSRSSSQGVRIHRGQTPRDLQSKKKKKERGPHTFFFLSQREAISGLRSQDRPNIQEWEELGSKSRTMDVLSLPPVLARLMQWNPWRGDVEGKEHGDGWSKPAKQKAITKWSRDEESDRRTGLEQMSARRGNGPTSVQNAERSLDDKAVPSLPSSYSSLPYLFQGSSRTPALV